MPASRIGDRPVSRVNLVDSFTLPSGRRTTVGRVARPGPGHLGSGADGKEVALAAAGRGRHDADAGARITGAVEPGQDVAGAQVQNPARTGVVHPGDLFDPVDPLTRIASVRRRASSTSRPTCSAQRSDDVDAVGQPRRVEAHLDLNRVEDRREDVAAAQLALAVGFFFLGDLLAIQLEAGQLLRRSGDDDRAPAVADGQHRWQHGAHILRELVEQLANAVGVGVGDRHHRRAVAEDGDAASTRHQRSGRADQLGHRQQFDVAGAAGLQGLDGEHTLGVSGHGHRRRVDQVQALPAQRADRRRSG